MEAQRWSPAPPRRCRTSTGAHRVAVVLFNFSNDTSQPYTPAIAQGVAFTNADSVAAYYSENSWGQLGLSGDVLGWYIDPGHQCELCLSHVGDVGQCQAVAAAGVDLGAYDNVVYAFPTTSCGWAGLANMPGKNSGSTVRRRCRFASWRMSSATISGRTTPRQLNCTEGGVRVALSSNLANCTSGRVWRSIQRDGPGHALSAFELRARQLQLARRRRILSPPRPRANSLRPVEVQTTSARTALRVQRTSSTWLTMEFRQPFGTAFETFAATAPLANGVTIRITPATQRDRVPADRHGARYDELR